jgi:rRNA maturation RNase YbeY
MNDEELCDINRRFLKHDTYTDIITFDLSSAPDNIEGEIYISLDRVTENALIYGTSIKEEFLRVMFHGVLHLLGYKDKSKKEKLHMRKAEDDCLILYRETNTHVSHETK